MNLYTVAQAREALTLRQAQRLIAGGKRRSRKGFAQALQAHACIVITYRLDVRDRRAWAKREQGDRGEAIVAMIAPLEAQIRDDWKMLVG